MEAVLRLAREDAGTHTVVSVIAGGNAASVRLHEKFGFTYSGTLHEVGLKFGRYLDIVNYPSCAWAEQNAPEKNIEKIRNFFSAFLRLFMQGRGTRSKRTIYQGEPFA